MKLKRATPTVITLTAKRTEVIAGLKKNSRFKKSREELSLWASAYKYCKDYLGNQGIQAEVMFKWAAASPHD